MKLKQMLHKLSLIFTGFLQVFFVAGNTWFIAHNEIVGIIIAGFIISYIWSHNVKKIAFGTEMDRIMYAIGAMAGSYSGYWTAKNIF